VHGFIAHVKSIASDVISSHCIMPSLSSWCEQQGCEHCKFYKIKTFKLKNYLCTCDEIGSSNTTQPLHTEVQWFVAV
jgi:hypothetical protein